MSTMEEKLTRWREEKRRKQEARRTLSSGSSLTSSGQHRTTIRTPPTWKQSPGLPPQSRPSPSVSSSRPPLSRNSFSSEQHLQRARNVLKERNYHQRSSSLKHRKRSSSTSPASSTRLFVTTRKSSDVIGLDISVASTAASSLMSPLSVCCGDDRNVTRSPLDSASKPLDSPYLCKEADTQDMVDKENAQPTLATATPLVLEGQNTLTTETPPATFCFDDDDESPQIPLTRRRRRTDDMFLLLPTPSPFENSASDSIQPSPMTAFSKVSPKPLSQCEPSNSEEPNTTDKVESLQKQSLSSGLKLELPVWDEEQDEDDMPTVRAQVTELARVQQQPFVEEKVETGDKATIESQTASLLLDQTVRVNEKTVLEPMTMEGNDEDVIEALKTKLQAVLAEKQSLQNRLNNIRKAYEQRVTPFRDVFEEKRKLQAENEQLQFVQEALRKRNEDLRKQKDEVNAMISELQSQMITSLQTAVQAKTQLQQELVVAHARIKELEAMAGTRGG